MPEGQPAAPPAGEAGTDAPGRRILVVEDSPTQRLMLSRRLRNWGYTVLEAADGHEALEAVRETPVPLILTDWEMPGLDGTDFCREVRAAAGAEPERYTYIILLTARTERSDVVRALEAGADDFLRKPVDEGELLARLAAGIRVTDMHERVQEGKRAVSEAYGRLCVLHEQLDRDLRSASLLQEAMVPGNGACNGAPVALVYRPAGRVGGDLVGYFAGGPGEAAVFALDVSGHGVAAALMVARLSQEFAPGDAARNVALVPGGPDAPPRLRDPGAVLTELNRRCMDKTEQDLYVAAAFAALDLGTGRVRLARAGYGYPLVLPRTGPPRYVEPGGPPLGIFAGAEIPVTEVALAPGERLVLWSDGLTEAARPDGSMIGEDGLARLLEDHADVAADEVLPRLLSRIEAEMGGQPFDDDLSAILIERP